MIHSTYFLIFFFRVRGTLGSLLVLTCNVGILFGYILAEYFAYFAQIKILLTIPVLYLLLHNYFPESPEYFMKRNQPKVRIEYKSNVILKKYIFDVCEMFQLARKSKSFYGRFAEDDINPSKMIKNKTNENIEILAEEEKIVEKFELEVEEEVTSLSLADFCEYLYLCLCSTIK